VEGIKDGARAKSNEIPGFSIEELCPPELWFADDVDGPWEWKGPVARSGKCLYGKLFNKT